MMEKKSVGTNCFVCVNILYILINILWPNGIRRIICFAFRGIFFLFSYSHISRFRRPSRIRRLFTKFFEHHLIDATFVPFLGNFVVVVDDGHDLCLRPRSSGISIVGVRVLRRILHHIFFWCRHRNNINIQWLKLRWCRGKKPLIHQPWTEQFIDVYIVREAFF